jgi:hypothetical protein
MGPPPYPACHPGTCGDETRPPVTKRGFVAPFRSTARRERDELLQTYAALGDRLAKGLRQVPRLSEAEAGRLRDERRALREAYYARLPRTTLSRCPFCGMPLCRFFDPWGLDGLWWQRNEGGRGPEPEACPHFRVLVGALNLNGLPPRGGRNESWPGPEVPYVIPRVLTLPRMLAVITSVPLANGYTAYPIAYFSVTAPPAGSLTQSWTEQTYGFLSAAGRTVWTVRPDPWDFDVRTWAERGRVKWIDPSDAFFDFSSWPPAAMPYHNLAGRREQLVIQGDRLSTHPPPAGEVLAPFE